MKKLSKILMIAISAILIIGALILCASALESYEWDESNLAIALYADEAAFNADKAADNDYANALGKYNCLETAIAQAKTQNAKYIALTNNWQLGGKDIGNGANGATSIFLDVEGLTVDLNGYTLYFSCAQYVNDKDGTEASVTHFLSVAADDVTIIGNGGAIESVAGIIENSGDYTLNIKGGEGGITLSAVTGHRYNDGSGNKTYTEITSTYNGNYIIKLGDKNWTDGIGSTGRLNMEGDIAFEKKISGCTAAVWYTGSTVITVGDAEGKRSSLSYVDTSGASGNGTETTYNALFYLATANNITSSTTSISGPYLKSKVSSRLDILNTDINLLSEKLFYAEYAFRIVSSDDIQYVNLDNCTVVADDHDANAANTVKGLFKFDRAAYLYLDIDNSDFKIYDTIYLIQCNYYSAYPKLNGRTVVKNSSILTKDKQYRNKTANTTGTLVFENCYLDFGYTIVTNGTAWAKYDPNADYAWPEYASELGGVGTLVKEGCTLVSNAQRSSGDNLGNISEVLSSSIGAYIAKDGAFSMSTAGTACSYIWAYSPVNNVYSRMVTTPEHKQTVVTSPTGIQTFNSLVTGNTYYDGTAPTVQKNTSWIVTSGTNPRSGKYTIAAGNSFNPKTGKFEPNDNKYIVNTYYADTLNEENIRLTYSSGPYFSTITTGVDSGAYSSGGKGNKDFSLTQNPSYTLEEVQYYTVDLDLMTPSDKFASGFFIYFYIKTLNSKGSVYQTGPQLSLSTTGTWTSNGTDSATKTYKMNYTPNVWQHITAVLEMPVTDVNGEKMVKLGNLASTAKWHLYIDGVKVHTFEKALPDAKVDTAANHSTGTLDGKHPFCALKEMRIGFASHTSVKTEKDATAVDNIAMGVYPLKTNMSLDSVASYMTNLQEKLGISTPDDPPFATYDDKTITVTEKESGLAEYINGITDGSITDTLCLYDDFTVDLNFFKKVSGFQSFSYKSNGYKINGLDDFCNVSYDEGKDIYTATVKQSYFTVNWYDLDGRLVKSDIVNSGNSIVLPETVMISESNGWYKNQYKWVDQAGNEITADYTPLCDIDAKMVFDKYVPYLTVASYNLKLMTNVEFDIFIPRNNIPDNIANIRVNGNKHSLRVINEVPYITFSSGVYSKTTEFDSKKDLTLSFDIIESDGSVTSLETTFKISVEDYIRYVVDNEDNYPDVHPVIADLLQYHVELYKALYPSRDHTTTPYYVLLDKLSDYATDLDQEISFNKNKTTASQNLSTLLESIQFVASGYAPAFRLNFKDSATNGGIIINDVRFVVDGYLTESKYNANAGLVTYGINTAEDTYQKDNNGSYTVVHTFDIPIYNIISDEIEIVLYATYPGEDSPRTVSGTYSFDTYALAVMEYCENKYGECNNNDERIAAYKNSPECTLNPSDFESTAAYEAAVKNAMLREYNIVSFLKSVKAYALSAAKYRFNGEKHYESETTVEATKFSSHTIAKTVYPGEKITYTIYLKNNGSSEKSIEIIDSVPMNTEYVEGADTINGKQLSWSFTLAAGEEKAVSYTVRVLNHDFLCDGEMVMATVASVNGRNLYTNSLYIERTLNEIDVKYIDIAIESLMESDFKEFRLLMWVYYVAYSHSVVSNHIGSATVPEELIEKIANGTATELQLDMIAPTLFGGKEMPSLINGVKDVSASAVSTNDLIVGDILLVKNGSDTKIYIYGSKGLFLAETGFEKVDTAAILASLSECDKYAVMRPSAAMTNFTPSNVDATPEPLTEKQAAVVETAKQYVLRGQWLQYDDSYYTYVKGGGSRAQYGIRAPEEYNSNEWGYINCAMFTYDAYKFSLNYSLPNAMYTTARLSQYSPQNGTKVYGFNRSANQVHSEEEKAKVKKEFTDTLQPGDIMVILRGTSGHAMLYIGDGNFIHSTGGSYSYSGSGSETYEPTIRYHRVNDYFFNESSTGGYIFGNVTELLIVRPLATTAAQNLTIPENTVNRINNLSGVVVQKYSTHNTAKTADRGDIITYTFSVRNTNKDSVTLDIFDKIPTNTFYVSSDARVDGDNLYWTVTVPADETVTVSYSVQVSDVAEYGSFVHSDVSTIGGVLVKCQKVQIERTLKSDEQTAIIQAFEELRNEGTTLTGLALVNEVYKRALGKENVFDSTDLIEVMEGEAGAFSYDATYDSNKGAFFINVGAKYNDMIAPSLYGGRKVPQRNGENWIKTRLPMQHHLVVGDVLVRRTSNVNNQPTLYVYLYVGGEYFYNVTSEIKLDTTLLPLRLEQLLYTGNYFAILRPSMAMDESVAE